ncbi:MAG: hypothetical protein V3S29_13800 [bacterium]
MEITRVHNPVGRSAAGQGMPTGARLDSLAGKVIGFIDDMKPNAGLFLRHIETMLKEEFQPPATHTVKKTLTSCMAIANELDESVEAVVIAWGD